MSTKSPAPTTAIGYAQAPNYNWWLYENETTPELQWPQSIFVYDQMRRTDSQVTSVLRAMTLPVRRTPWRIDPNGARDEVVQLVADDLGLPIVGQKPKAPPRSKDKFSWPEHLRQALLMLPFGHMYFEVLYRVDKDGKRAHLRKLEPRMPKTIERIDVAPDGGLVSIKQYWTTVDTTPKPIPVDRLVAYIHEREGGNWLGSSILRPAYKNWLLKDRLLRVQAQTIERNGMGIPLYKGAPDATDLSAGLAMAKAWRAGEAAGSAIPHDADLILRGVEGTLPDAEPAIRYHDEQIGRAVLAHFLNLGTQTGSWALGTTFADFFTLSLQTLADQIADTATQHIVEDLVDVNFGEDEPAPRLICDEIGSRQAATAEAMAALVNAGILRPDEVLEESSRQQYGLPPADTATTRPPPGTPPPPTDGPVPPPDGGPDGGGPVDGGAGADLPPEPLPVPLSASADPSPEEPQDADEPLEASDDLAAAVAEALAHFARAPIAAAHDVSSELRIPGGKGGGRWTTGGIGRAIADALEQWSKGKGPDDPFHHDGKPIDREHLRKAGVARGLTFKRGASRDDIVHALLEDARSGAKDARETRAARRASAKFSFDHNGKRVDAAVFTDKPGGTAPSLREVDDLGHPGRIITSQPDLAGLERWATTNGHTDVADWAQKERGGKPDEVKAPAKRTPRAPAKATRPTAKATLMAEAQRRRVYLSQDEPTLPQIRAALRDADAREKYSRDNPLDVAQLRDVTSYDQAHALVDGRSVDELLAIKRDLGVPPGSLASAFRDRDPVAQQNRIVNHVVPDARIREGVAPVMPTQRDRFWALPKQDREAVRQSVTDSASRDQWATALDAAAKRAPAKKATKAAEKGSPLRGDAALAAAPIHYTTSEQLGKPSGTLRGADATPAQLAALDSHSQGGFRATNRALRSGVVPAPAAHIDALMAQSKLTDSVEVERGIRTGRDVFGDPSGWPDSLVGKEFTDPAYVSTGTTSGPADLFATTDDFSVPNGVKLRIKVPAGTGAIAIGQEHELLLERGLHFRVVGDSGKPSEPFGARVLDVEVVPKPTKAAEVATKAVPSKAVAKVAGAKAPKATKPPFDAADVRTKLAAVTSREDGHAVLKGLTVAQLREVSPTAVASSKGKADAIDRVLQAETAHLYSSGIADRLPSLALSGPAGGVATKNLPSSALSHGLAGSPWDAAHADGLDALEGPQLRKWADEMLPNGGKGMSDAQMRAALRAEGVGSPEVEHAKRLAEDVAQVDPESPARKAEVENKIRAAYRDLQRQPGDWVPLTSIRDHVKGVDRSELDEALTRISMQPGSHVIPWDNAKVLSARDKAAAVRIGGADAHVIRLEDPAPTAPVHLSDAQIESKVREVYAQLVDRPGIDFVSLADVRDRLPDIPRSELDRVLVAMAIGGNGVGIYPESNQKMLKQRHRDAAVSIGNQDKHLIKIQGQSGGGARPKGERGASDLPKVAAKWHPAPTRAQADLYRTSEQPDIAPPISAGNPSNGRVEIRTTAGGRVVFKAHENRGVRNPKETADAEQLSSLVSEAVGVATPTFVRTGDSQWLTSFIDGTPGVDLVPKTAIIPPEIRDTPDGRRMGLLDLLITNPDRNPSNWYRDADGRLIAYDHGQAFTGGENRYFAERNEYFSGHFAATMDDAGPNDIPRADAVATRDRLLALRPEFERLGRDEWWQQMMSKMDQVLKWAS